MKTRGRAPFTKTRDGELSNEDEVRNSFDEDRPWVGGLHSRSRGEGNVSLTGRGILVSCFPRHLSRSQDRPIRLGR
ncbi:Hypothetical protein FKW44_007199 [Caligus rogercresseyi]|uniref:Uncharacterized protein n=1 Tax=Caligus rogercresseyi TaxID=217165 RepID=A0A7T8QTD1_CALRO|nr:Hypothetical protein FKW44_007199 [Caligus rogercresseyi]